MGEKSPVVQLMESVYRNTNTVGGRSWQNLNTAMKEAFSLVIKARFRFEVGDVIDLANRDQYSTIGFTDWIGTDYEQFYRLAVEEANHSACIAFEAWQKRKPFIYCGKRLAVGSAFLWWVGDEVAALEALTQEQLLSLKNQSFNNGRNHWYVTSFAEDGSSITACNYWSETNPGGWQTGSPKHVIKLTIKDLKAMEKTVFI